jgi:hypothetical protein
MRGQISMKPGPMDTLVNRSDVLVGLRLRSDQTLRGRIDADEVHEFMQILSFELGGHIELCEIGACLWCQVYRRAGIGNGQRNSGQYSSIPIISYVNFHDLLAMVQC